MPSFMYYKLLEACREPGCPVCRLEQQSVERYLDNQFYENVNSPRWREHLRGSHGFCHEHVWLAVERRLGDALGFSIIYHDVVNNVLRSMGGDEESRQKQASVRERVEKWLSVLRPHKRCPACEHRDQTRRDLLAAVVDDLRSPEITEALAASEGVCLPHLQALLGQIKDEARFAKLLMIQRSRMERLRDELAEFIRKNDYQAIKEGFGSEGDAWLRAIGLVAGKRK